MGGDRIRIEKGDVGSLEEALGPADPLFAPQQTTADLVAAIDEISDALRSVAGIPYYAYGDNEAACVFADALQRINTAFPALHAGRVGSGEVEAEAVEGVVAHNFNFGTDRSITVDVHHAPDWPIGTRVRVTALPKEAE